MLSSPLCSCQEGHTSTSEPAAQLLGTGVGASPGLSSLGHGDSMRIHPSAAATSATPHLLLFLVLGTHRQKVWD